MRKLILLFALLILPFTVNAQRTNENANVVVSSNLTVNASNIFNNPNNNRVGINTRTPGFSFDVVGSGNVFGTLSVTGNVAQIISPLGSLTASPSNSLSFLSIDGGLKLDRRIVSVNYTNQIGDLYIAMRPTVIAVTNFLPSATSVGAGITFIVKDEGLKASITNIFILPALGTDRIDGATSRTINTDAGSFNFTSDGVGGWFIW